MRPPDPTPPPGPLTICVVDDHAAMRDQIVALLIASGHEVCGTAGSVALGLEAILLHRPDVAVIDNRLPDGSGVELCRRLSTAQPDVRLVLHTGVLGPSTEQEARAAGASAVVAKSVRGTGLLAALRPPP